VPTGERPWKVPNRIGKNVTAAGTFPIRPFVGPDRGPPQNLFLLWGGKSNWGGPGESKPGQAIYKGKGDERGGVNAIHSRRNIRPKHWTRTEWDQAY